MKTQDINRLIYNPVWVASLLHYFLSGTSESPSKKIKFELIYLAIPFIINEALLIKLQSSTRRSSIESLFKSNEMKNSLVGIDKKIGSFKEITNKALLVLGKKIIVTEDGFIQIECIQDYRNDEEPLRSYYKAAFNLGLILSKEHYREIFLKIGVVI